ncbi:hypothetical protein LEP1GSC016_3849 [Leptospira borgpetersenii serovar Hardjo-bovis str. Sponselee]|uniref:Uncharacterized protein n=1 Tax=Leptospira borgpetersenii serovar Hardjo-bovis str. Sponselee TaxID=1303729 RepID=M6BZL9_LEPBO|nr:hypothetical protein LBK6_01590 [Leptospira borgpetersenii serovar Hardjo]EMJ81858.1 hypothetical protein LEP1GSC016_3849 [Leptospira borgpetersenii serovar Hardjo-bovis str. Sponselee]AMX60365.1 hypothetical protein LBK9_01590 [Leptospira borgpetersenii serovar Hardjo]AMX63612.1 hypothetical protein LBK30_01605 [Leptospira borgpetersenii serovar Hardjo]AMX66851.1 hypothetical protein LBHA_01605 [Leptospira borgpetersenii serovar Hardjo]
MNLSSDGIRKLIFERTEEFKNSVDFQKPWTMAEYRKVREEKEVTIRKKDELVYNCPFLGAFGKRIGCMIHPIFSGDPLSQNYSFYGSSICQGYKCRNMERKSSKLWESLLSEMELDSFTYSAIASDYQTLDLIEETFSQKGISIQKLFQSKKELLKRLIQRKIDRNVAMMNTSFEISMEEEKNSAQERLVQRLSLASAPDLSNEIDS